MQQDEGGQASGEAYEGVARSSGGRATAETLAEAISQAWDKGKHRHKSFRVAEITVSGDNPISEYRVVLRPR